ncbi:MAG: class I SAM-dependent methyltransferase [Pseudomonadota bacterium]
MENQDDTRETPLATERLKEVFSRGSVEELCQSYGQWADDYDKDLVDELGYRAPELVASAAARHVSETDIPILDVGCGTGLTGKALLECGDWTLHGLDVSQAMLDQANEKTIYDELILADLNGSLAIADDTYAGAISSGTFTHGHVKADALCEISRILKPGAPFAFTVHSEFWDKSRFPETLEQLATAQQLRMVERVERPHIDKLPDKTSFVCVAVAA